MYENSDNEPNRKSAMTNIIIGCQYNLIVQQIKKPLYVVQYIRCTTLLPPFFYR